jgi:Na+-transporting methylmalonyl-CoA/oxaloacetate decarboxylase gamma subunit
MPGWVRVFGIVFLILVVLIVVMLAGGHNPARHLPGADMSSHTPPSSMTEHGGHVP